ncbi:peptide-methionine (S)-S-oxide reductase [Luteimonas cucumeris]|uniref:Peptide methionine sulfoxide reductase MsrA n=1 Tax=Luteimonas cucumeris TaxID=985012 RepID=A0A562L0F3_9GAMM|nr:peptide-methionine (S)-S-oxide reductase MsrA [Luteimonas cucumeris]TWI01006.1 peptide-methionine (S)-S-oxide reductase [Luteimonas cucumeris]
MDIRTLARCSLRALLAAAVCTALLACNAGIASSKPVALPDPEIDPPFSTSDSATAVLAGGCFWGVEAVFEHVKGVRQVSSGYAGGDADDANYHAVSRGRSDHAEVVKVVYDPSQISYGQLLKVFFSVAHDPTQLNRQGPDRGRQYRSAIFYGDAQQKRIAQAYVAQLDAAKAFPSPIVTQLVPLQKFHPAEAYHQDYARLHPNDPYIVHNDAPKVVALKQQFPKLYRPEPIAVSVR